MFAKKSVTAIVLMLATVVPAMAQNATSTNENPACARTEMKGAQADGGSASPTSMAATTSDGGQTTTGASSASIGTGPVDKTGVNSPCVAALSGHGSTGALPTSSSP
jgi:hypothetical protein